MTAPDLTPRRLSSDLTVHPLGAGCWAIGGPTVNEGSPVGWSTADNGRSLEGLRRAVAHGANLFDTADVYGHGDSERLLKQLLREFPREELSISSKVGWVRGTAPHAYAGPKLYHQFLQTLDNLGTEYLDVYFLHTLDFGDDDRYLGDGARAGNERGDPRGHGARGRVDAVPVAQRSQITVPRAGRENQASRGA
jgi:aryl-alcohol dehydrogenase-like predicted oxidoreductase